jgi:Uma2 family endonuclease
MVETKEKIYTVEEYFELEKTSDIRHEFVHGKLIPMPGESKNANKIAGNCYKQLIPLEEKGFDIYIHNVRTMVEEKGIYRYPDVVVASESDDEDTHNVTQPVMIIEVLSESTAREDRGAKLREYTQLPTLQHYLILAQDQKSAEMYTRRDEEWIVQFFDEKNDPIMLSAFGIELSLKAIYKKVKF